MPRKACDPEPRFKDEEYANIIREMIHHEDSVLAQRVTWCGTIEGLLMTSLGFAWKTASSQFVYVVAGIGIIVAAVTLYASFRTVATMAELTKDWNDRRAEDYDGPPVIGMETHLWSRFFRPSRAIPGTFILLWIAIAVVRFFWPFQLPPDGSVLL
jgi:hypothetical protein